MSGGQLPDHLIRKRVLKQKMIEPFIDHQVRDGAISYGLESFGYDARVAPAFLIVRADADPNAVIDPKNFREDLFETRYADPYVEIPGNSFALACTVEYFRVPEDILALCYDKSTYARCAVAVHVTALNPGWEGYVTLEIANRSPQPVRIYGNEGICRFVFFEGADTPEKSYADLDGKYMGQSGLTVPAA